MNKSLNKRLVAALSVVVFFACVVWWLSGRSFIAVQSNASGEGAITLTNVDTKQQIEITTPSGEAKKLVPKGEYEVLVRQDERSYLKIVRTSGFLKTTRIEASLKSESDRSFVGSNPNICMYDFGMVLASDPCGGEVDELELHMPASDSQPSYTKKAIGPAAKVEGVLTIASGNIAVVRAQREGEGQGSHHLAFSVTDQGVFIPSSERELAELSGSRIYKARRYLDGFIAYTDTPSDAWYYSADFVAKKIDIETINDESLGSRTLYPGEDVLITAYGNHLEDANIFQNPEGTTSHTEESEKGDNKKPRSILLIQKNQDTKRIELKKTVIDAVACSSNKLCVLTDEAIMYVYSLEGNHQLMYRVGGVLAIKPGKSGLVLVRNSGLVSFDTDTKQGYLQYAFGDYRYCGINKSSAKNILCLADMDNRRYALLVSDSEPMSDNIDKQIISLLNDTNIKAVSAYGRYIHISPRLGEIVYREDIKGYGYDLQTKRIISEAIDKRVTELGINTNKYLVINPYRN